MAAPLSSWDRSSAEPAPEPGFAGPDTVDIAIIGGGYTGLSTALHSAEAGLSAHVIEAQVVGHGGSGRNVGLVNAGVWLPPSKLRATMGEAKGAKFLARFAQGPAEVFDLIERHQIRCEATRAGTIHAAHAPSGQRDLAARHADWQAMGAPVELLSRAEVEALTGSPAFHGGLLDHRAGTINPMGYARGLARAAKGAGARISSGVRATGLTREGTLWHVQTDHGEVTARHVVLATNAYCDALWPGLSRCHTEIRYFQLATEPLGARIDALLPSGQGLWDTGTIMRSLRKDKAGRLIIGSMGRLIGGAERGLSRNWAARQLARIFPDLGPVRFEDAWDGRIAMTPDHLPQILHLAEGLYAPTAYNGRGITTGTLFGKSLAGLIAGAPEETLPLPVTNMAPLRAPRLQARAYDAAFLANQLWKSLAP